MKKGDKLVLTKECIENEKHLPRFTANYAKELSQKANKEVEELLDILYSSIERSAEEGLYFTSADVATFSSSSIQTALNFLTIKGFKVQTSEKNNKISFLIEWA